MSDSINKFSKRETGNILVGSANARTAVRFASAAGVTQTIEVTDDIDRDEGRFRYWTITGANMIGTGEANLLCYFGAESTAQVNGWNDALGGVGGVTTAPVPAGFVLPNQRTTFVFPDGIKRVDLIPFGASTDIFVEIA